MWLTFAKTLNRLHLTLFYFSIIIFSIFAFNTAMKKEVSMPSGMGGYTQILIIIGMFVIIYLVLFLPESNRRKKLKQQISQMKPGDKVLTSSGIYGTIDFISEKSVYIKSLDSKLEVSKESIAAVLKNQ